MYKGELREEIAEMIKKSQKEKPLADLLREYIRSDRVSLHIPGHKGGGGISEGKMCIRDRPRGQGNGL